MAQFAPIFCLLVFFGLWSMYVLILCSLWWTSKRPYSFS
nr:ATP synthase F0 subunit 8 [Marcia japonica]UYR95104.1 ATP synthase subunit 8 [Marcia japonica]